jgi:PAP2 superfamily
VILVALAALAVAPVAPAKEKQQSARVQEWIGVTLDEIKAHSTTPPRASRTLAHVSAALYPAAALGSDAAIDGAAATVLSYFYPDRAAYFEGRVGGDARRAALGRLVGRVFVARATNDGSSVAWTGSIPAGPGLWVPTPAGFAPPLEPLAGTWRTWSLRSGSQFRPGPPPAFGSAAYRAEIHEVYDVSKALTQRQREIALHWADGAGTVTPPGHWNQIALDLTAGANLSPVQAARVFATLNTAQADAFIACWDAKFAYWLERPVTAIRREIDPAWTPLIGTPPFPAYTSGHSTTSGAASTVLAHFFPRERASLAAMAEEAMNSRLYGGIHFRADNEAGLALGKRVGREALRSPLLVPPRGDD